MVHPFSTTFSIANRPSRIEKFRKNWEWVMRSLGLDSAFTNITSATSSFETSLGDSVPVFYSNSIDSGKWGKSNYRGRSLLERSWDILVLSLDWCQRRQRSFRPGSRVFSGFESINSYPIPKGLSARHLLPDLSHQPFNLAITPPKEVRKSIWRKAYLALFELPHSLFLSINPPWGTFAQPTYSSSIAKTAFLPIHIDGFQL